MGEAIAGGLVASGLMEPASILVTDPKPARREQLARDLGVSVDEPGPRALAGADAVLLAVKPQVLARVVADIAPALADVLVISIVGGATTARLASLLPSSARVVRVMPNTPALVRAGVAIVSGGDQATPSDIAAVSDLFAGIGEVVVVSEHLQDACTAISGCGPAYMAIVVDALARAGVREGLPRATAERLAVATMRGTAELIAMTGQHPEQVVDAVCSPGGSTIAAVAELEAHAVRSAFDDAVAAAVVRSRELGRA